MDISLGIADPKPYLQLCFTIHTAHVLYVLCIYVRTYFIYIHYVCVNVRTSVDSAFSCMYVRMYVCMYAPPTRSPAMILSNICMCMYLCTYMCCCPSRRSTVCLCTYVHTYVHTSLVSHAGEPPPSASHLSGGRDGRSLAPQHIRPSGRHGCAV